MGKKLIRCIQTIPMNAIKDNLWPYGLQFPNRKPTVEVFFGFENDKRDDALYVIELVNAIIEQYDCLKPQDLRVYKVEDESWNNDGKLMLVADMLVESVRENINLYDYLCNWASDENGSDEDEEIEEEDYE